MIYTRTWKRVEEQGERESWTFFFRGWETQTRIFLVLDIFGFTLLSTLLWKLREGFTKSTITDIRLPPLKSLFLPSVSFVSRFLSKENELYTYSRAHTRTHTRDIKKISLPDVDDFLICCKIITLNSIAKVLLGSHFFLFKILLTKTEKLG